MKSSYNVSNLGYNDLFKTLILMVQPGKIVEFGILEGYSLLSFIQNSYPDCIINAYDIFDKFNGNGADKMIIEKFKEYNNVKIEEGDFYEKYISFEDNSIDILHIDIANDGDVYKFTIDNYLSKISDKGVIILEGGSKERDEVRWMIKYNKTPINPYIKKLQKRLDIIVEVIEKYPSVTIIKKNSNLKIRLIEYNDYYKKYMDLINYFTKKVNELTYINFCETLDLIRKQNSIIVVIEYKNIIIATCKLIIEQKLHNNLKKMGHIEDVIVDKDFKGKHIGNLLLNECFKIGKENNCYKIVLNCNKDIIDFYKKNNMVVKGTEMCIYL